MKRKDHRYKPAGKLMAPKSRKMFGDNCPVFETFRTLKRQKAP